MPTHSNPNSKAGRRAGPRPPRYKPAPSMEDPPEIGELFQRWNRRVGLPEFYSVDDLAHLFNAAPGTVRRWVTESNENSFWRPCSRGRWHRIQVQLMVAVTVRAISPDSGDARWAMARLRLKTLLHPDAAPKRK